MTHEPRKPGEGFDEMDPHGYEGHGSHASHVIVGPITLRTVLAILLLFTALTVACAQAEQWAQAYFGIILPHWINVVGVLFIATVKSILVAMYFMQLRYDNPMNSMVVAFSIFCLIVFIGFTGIDLFTRGEIYPEKQGQVVPGGTGLEGKPVYLAAREKFEKSVTPEEAARIEASMHHGHGHGGGGWYPTDRNNPNRSRPRTGLTVDGAPGHDPHATPHAPAPATGH